MDLNKFLATYLSIDQNYIKPLTKSRAIESKDEFYRVLSWWAKLSKSETIGDLSKMNKNTPLIRLKFGSSFYFINADTKKNGVRVFLSNKNDNWHLIPNEDGKLNKITNRLNKSSIEGFYMYKEI